MNRTKPGSRFHSLVGLGAPPVDGFGRRHRSGRSHLAWLLLLATALAPAACVGKKKDDVTAEADVKRLAPYIRDAAPEMKHKVNVDFDGKVKLLGYDIAPEGEVKPGGKVKVTMYWKCEQSLGHGWLLFTHLLDANGKRIQNLDYVGPLREKTGSRQALWPAAWAPGKVYVDEQEFTIPKKVDSESVQLAVGMFRGKERLKIRKGPADRQDRALVVSIPTGVKAKPKEQKVPELRVDKLKPGTAITIDGKLEEDAWKKAPTTGAFVDVGTGKVVKGAPIGGAAKLLWDAQALYVGFEVTDEKLQGGFPATAKDPHIWEKDGVEILIDPDGDGDAVEYYEIQVSPQNLVFDTWFDKYNEPKKEPDGPFGHQEWSSKITSKVVLKGKLDDEEKDEGYVVEAKIPWSSLGKAKKAPPAVGDQWRMNLYVVEQNKGVAWSPILGQGNFHKASRFGRVLWAEEGWKPAPKDKDGAVAGADPSAKPAESAAPAGSTKPAPKVPVPGAATPAPKAPAPGAATPKP